MYIVYFLLEKKEKRQKGNAYQSAWGLGGRLPSSVSERWPGSVAHATIPALVKLRPEDWSPSPPGLQSETPSQQTKTKQKAKEAKGRKSLISGVLSPKEWAILAIYYLVSYQRSPKVQSHVTPTVILSTWDQWW